MKHSLPFSHKILLKGWRAVLSFLGLFLGFSHAVVAQYGVIETQFSFRGTVTTEKGSGCGGPCPEVPAGLKISMQGRDWEHNLYTINEGITDDQGRFALRSYHMPGGDTLTFVVKDVDGRENGLFRDTVFVMRVEDLGLTDENGGHWTQFYTNKTPIILKVRCEDQTPCPEIPDPLEPSLPVPSDSVAEPAIAEIPADSANADSIAAETADTSAWIFVNDHQGQESFQILAYPNPNTGWLQLSISAQEPGRVMLYLFDDRYRKLLEEQFDMNGSSFQHTLDLSRFAPGTYFLEVRAGSVKEVIKILRMGH